MRGGKLTCMGSASDGGVNSFKLAHWNKTKTSFNMSGGSVYLENRLCLCINGTGHFNMSGGTLEALGVCLNGRESVGGMGYMEMTGGTLKLRGVSSLHADWYDNKTKEQAYEARLGGAGSPTIYGFFEIQATAALTGQTSVEAVNFEVPYHASKAAYLKRDLTGEGGFNKTGQGTLFVGTTLSCSGAVRVVQGGLKFETGRDNAMTNALIEICSGGVLSYNGTKQKFGGLTASRGDWTVPNDITFVAAPRYLVEPVTTADGATVHAVTFPGDVDLSSWTVCGMPSLTNLNTDVAYVIARSASGKLSGKPRMQDIPKPWRAEVEDGVLKLKGRRGLFLMIR